MRPRFVKHSSLSYALTPQKVPGFGENSSESRFSSACLIANFVVVEPISITTERSEWEQDSAFYGNADSEVSQ
jgi:hypothetical protein